MKKITAILLALCLVFSLTACSSGETSESTESAAATTEKSAAESVSASADTPADTTAAPESTEEVHETISPAVPYPDGDDFYEFDCSKDLDEKGYYKAFQPEDHVKLPESLELTIPYDVHTPSQEKIDAAIMEIVDSFGTVEQITNRAVADGDTINIDYVGTLEGKEFQGGSTGGYGTTVTVGVTNYVDDFLQKLIGHMPGETFDIDIKFPEDYSNADLAGKDTVFNVTINYIAGETILPEINDAFVKENLSSKYGWTTAEEMNKSITDDLAAEAVQDYIYDYLINNSTVTEVPQEMIDYMQNYFIYYHSYVAASYQTTLPVLIANYGFTSMADMLADYDNDIRVACQEELVMQSAGKLLNVDLTGEDLEAYFMAELGRTDYSLYEENFGLPYVKKMVLSWKVVQLLKEQATLLPQ